MFQTKINVFICLSALALSISCSDSKSSDAQEFKVQEVAPSDSTGTATDMSVNFSSSESMALTDAGATRAIGTDIVLNYAKFSLAKIRIKALKELSNDEKTQDAMEVEDEKVAVAEVEAQTSESAANLLDSGKSAEKKKNDRAEKIKEHRAKLDAKEKKDIDKEAARDSSTKFKGPFVYDAISGKIEGDALSATLPDGTYRRVEFQMKRNFTVPESEALLGNVFAIRGTVLKAGVPVPFEIDWHIAMNFRLRATDESAIKVTAGEANALVIDFDLAKWFEGIDLTAAAVDDDGIIYISKDSNREIMKALHHNIKVNSHFGKDKDGNKVLDDHEKVGKGEAAADAEVK